MELYSLAYYATRIDEEGKRDNCVYVGGCRAETKEEAEQIGIEMAKKKLPEPEWFNHSALAMPFPPDWYTLKELEQEPTD